VVHSGLEGRRILVVEDEALIAMVIEDTLREEGAEVVGAAASVNEALRLITENNGPLDAAVLDVRLGDSHVLPVANRLAALGLPFVFVTGYQQADIEVHRGAPVLRKPFDTDELAAVLAGLLRPR